MRVVCEVRIFSVVTGTSKRDSSPFSVTLTNSGHMRLVCNVQVAEKISNGEVRSALLTGCEMLHSLAKALTLSKADGKAMRKKWVDTGVCASPGEHTFINFLDQWKYIVIRKHVAVGTSHSGSVFQYFCYIRGMC